MTDEFKRQLLIKDLCARIKSGTIMHINSLPVDEATKETETDTLAGIDNEGTIMLSDYSDYDISEVTPYLHWESDLGYSAKKELKQLKEANDHAGVVDFYIRNHVDYHGLLPMGLALEVPEWMYWY